MPNKIVTSTKKQNGHKKIQIIILILLLLAEMFIFLYTTRVSLGIVQIMMMATTGATFGYLLVLLIFVAAQLTFFIWTVKQLIWFGKQKN
ncbi:hypothetical protein [Paucilactobacillus wasatchensis]|nr:hypothetical protein [Paucilactobacillus wasatchensis]